MKSKTSWNFRLLEIEDTHVRTNHEMYLSSAALQVHKRSQLMGLYSDEESKDKSPIIWARLLPWLRATDARKMKPELSLAGGQMKGSRKFGERNPNVTDGSSNYSMYHDKWDANLLRNTVWHALERERRHSWKLLRRISDATQISPPDIKKMSE